MNARQREIGVLLSIGLSKMEIFVQFVWELLFISIPAFIGAAAVATLTGKQLEINYLRVLLQVLQNK